MAGSQVDNVWGWVDKRNTVGMGGNPSSGNLHTWSKDNTAMRAKLQAVDATLYSNANLDKMTRNDMVYALRVTSEPASL